tara:strand:+ start:387 stop:1265 length:879 start_codon:yes stop_codon:yes gene_type:complete
MNTSFTNSKGSLAGARRDTTDWPNLTSAEKIQSIELEGFVVLPNLLNKDTLEKIKEELGRLPTKRVDYSQYQRTFSNIQWTDSPTTIQTIGNPTVTKFLGNLFGDDLICTSCSYTCADPGHPGIVIHTDSQPYGSKIFGVQASAPVLARVLFYLDDQTSECSPFKVIPKSHLSMHRDGNPYNRYLRHPDEIMVTCKAGSAVVINQKVFHGNYPNHSDRSRRMLAIAYRPAWAGPIGEVEDRDPAMVAKLPGHIQPYFRSLNIKIANFDQPNRPENMQSHAPGIAPSRWQPNE